MTCPWFGELERHNLTRRQRARLTWEWLVDDLCMRLCDRWGLRGAWLAERVWRVTGLWG